MMLLWSGRANPSWSLATFHFTMSILNRRPDSACLVDIGIADKQPGSPYASSSVDDITFTQQLLTYLSSHYCLDSTRFYASGHSNGGGFCNTIACWPGLSGRFAAFAPNSAAIYVGSRGPNDVCKPDHAITPMLELHGHADPVIPYDGGKVAGGLSSVPPILDWITGWVTRNGCAASSFVSNVPFPGKVSLRFPCHICRSYFNAHTPTNLETSKLTKRQIR